MSEFIKTVTDGVLLLQPDDAEVAAITALGVQPIVRDLADRSRRA